MNNITLFGRLTGEPELRSTDNGTKYAKFLLAVDRRTKEKTTDFIDCIAWSKLAEIIAQYVHKGNQLSLSGSLETSSYEKNGEKRKAYVVNIKEIDFVSQTKTNEAKAQNEPEDESSQNEVKAQNEPEDEGSQLPFRI